VELTMDSNEPARFTVYDEVPPDVDAVIDTGLDASNAAAAPLDEVRPISCVARLPTGEIIGGVIGRTWGACCEVQQIWVHPSHRRKGIGARLMRELHGRANERGCRTFYLETFSFQAPSLYRALGYEVRLEIAGFTTDIRKYVMVREVSGVTP
jgi:ribosomal protein S18 acetylase RimI-like enzyme